MSAAGVSQFSQKKIRSESGFTLIEVLVALTIFAFGLLALAGMQITSLKGNSRAQSTTAKVAIADAVIEEFLTMDGDDERLISLNPVDNADEAPFEYDWPNANGLFVDGAGNLTAAVVVTPDPDDADGNPLDGLTEIVVTVTNELPPAVTKRTLKRRF